MKKTQNVLETVYGAGLLANWTTITWAISKVQSLYGAEIAAAEMKKVNRFREKHGHYNDIPQFGTTLWTAYFKK